MGMIDTPERSSVRFLFKYLCFSSMFVCKSVSRTTHKRLLSSLPPFMWPKGLKAWDTCSQVNQLWTGERGEMLCPVEVGRRVTK